MERSIPAKKSPAVRVRAVVINQPLDEGQVSLIGCDLQRRAPSYVAVLNTPRVVLDPLTEFVGCEAGKVHDCACGMGDGVDAKE